MTQWCDYYLVNLICQEIIGRELTISQIQIHPYLILWSDNSIPDFKISITHLSSEVVKALMDYDCEEKSVVLKQVGADVFTEFYRSNIHPRLGVKLID